MKTSTEGLMALVGHEGIVLSTYLDSEKVPTIGIGHTAAAGPPNPKTFTGKLSIAEAFALFRKDVSKYEAAVAATVKVPLKQHEFDALVSFHYNTGAIGKASFVKKLNAGDRAGAIKGIMDWKKPAAIIPRRTAERDLFRTGIYPAPFANIYPVKANGTPDFGKPVRVDLRKMLAAPPPPVEPAKPAPAPVEPPKPAVPIPVPPEPTITPTPPAGRAKGIWALIIAALLGAWLWIATRPCEWLGLFCGG
jgi:lysozyme